MSGTPGDARGWACTGPICPKNVGVHGGLHSERICACAKVVLTVLKQQSTDSLLRRGRMRTVCLEEWHALEAGRAELQSRLPAAEQLQGSLTQTASAVLGLICMHLRPLVATEPRLLERWASEIGALPQASLGGAAFMR